MHPLSHFQSKFGRETARDETARRAAPGPRIPTPITPAALLRAPRAHTTRVQFGRAFVARGVFAAHPKMEHHTAAADYPGLDCGAEGERGYSSTGTQHESASGHEGAVGGAGGRGRGGRAGRAGRRTMMTRTTRPAMRPLRPRPPRAGRESGSDAAEGARKRGAPNSVRALLPGSPGASAWRR